MSSERRPLVLSELPLSGVHLIEASAGTGKTYTIAALFLRLLLQRELPIEQILAVTFTTAATLELRERVAERLEQARRFFVAGGVGSADPLLQTLHSSVPSIKAIALLERAQSNMDRANIHTIHGFAARALGEYAFELGTRMGVVVEPNLDDAIYDAAIDFWTEQIRTLDARRYSALGDSLLSDLTKLAKISVHSRDVPLVDLSQLEALVGQGDVRDSARQVAFDAAAKIFREDGESALGLLLSPVVNKNTFRVQTVEASFWAFHEYFEAGVAAAELPEANWRWAQGNVNAKLKKGQKALEHPFFAAVECLHDAVIGAQEVDHARRAILFREARKFVIENVQSEHQRSRRQSFDDFLTVLGDALRQGGEIALRIGRTLQARHTVALIDEFQDTDTVQYGVFRALFAERPDPGLFLVGDPKQSIYAFRGADVFAYLRAQKDADQVWTMSVSYRSSPHVVQAQNALLGRTASPFLLSDIVYEPVSARQGSGNELCAADGSALPGFVLVSTEPSTSPFRRAASDIAQMLRSGATISGKQLSAQNFAVLCRTNRQAMDVQRELARLSIPAVMHGDRSVFESDEAIEILRIMRGLTEGRSRIATRTALGTALFGLRVQELYSLDEDAGLLAKWDETLRQLAELWRRRGIFAALEQVLIEHGAVERLLTEPGGERCVTNLRHLTELLHTEESTRHLGPLALTRFLEAAIADPFGMGDATESRQIRLESDADAVVLTTIHKSKGLEYDIVVLPTLEQSEKLWNEPAFRFHTDDGLEWLELRDEELAPDSYLSRKIEVFSESLRLGYVAVTRAKHQVRVLVGGAKSGFSSMRYWCAGERNEPGEQGAMLERISKLEADRYAQHLDELGATSGGTIGRVHFDAALGLPLARPELVSPLQFVALQPTTRLQLQASRRTGSFSSMSRSERVTPRQAARDVADLPADNSEKRALQGEEPKGRPISMAEFPRGPDAGDALHQIFQNIPFERAQKEERQRVAAGVLDRFGIGQEHLKACVEMLDDVLESNLPGAFCLADLAPRERGAELEFHLPAGKGGRELTRRELAQAFEDASEIPVSYRSRLECLEFGAWHGFLRGFIDLTLEHDGKLYVVDYKSNFLGPVLEDYSPQRIEAVMSEHHYYLQAVLYACAVHAHASQRIAGYEYEQHFGGVMYLFVRGMTKAEPDRGVCFFRPSEALLGRVLAAVRGGAA